MFCLFFSLWCKTKGQLRVKRCIHKYFIGIMCTIWQMCQVNSSWNHLFEIFAITSGVIIEITFNIYLYLINEIFWYFDFFRILIKVCGTFPLLLLLLKSVHLTHSKLHMYRCSGTLMCSCSHCIVFRAAVNQLFKVCFSQQTCLYP